MFLIVEFDTDQDCPCHPRVGVLAGGTLDVLHPGRLRVMRACAPWEGGAVRRQGSRAVPGFYLQHVSSLLPVVMTKSVFPCCHQAPGGQKRPCLKTTDVNNVSVFAYALGFLRLGTPGNCAAVLRAVGCRAVALASAHASWQHPLPM